MIARVGLILVASFLMAASVAHAENIPSNAELFRMLKAQQQTISKLRAELKQMRQERRGAVASEPRKVETASKQAGRGVAREAVAATTPESDRGAYFSLFGGWAAGNNSTANQLGTVFIPAASGGPLSVDATGRAKTDGVGFVGAQLGYQWSYGSRLLPALEIEGLYLPGTQQRATLENYPTGRTIEQTFDDTFTTSTVAVLANAVVGFRTPYQRVTPYLGVGMGVAHISFDSASST